MIDTLIPQVDEIQGQGASVLLKWGGERTHLRCTIVVTRKDTDYAWRKDCDDMAAALSEALCDYKAKHAQCVAGAIALNT